MKIGTFPEKKLSELTETDLSVMQDVAIDTLLKELYDLDFVAKVLQDESVALAEARTLFDEVKSLFPNTENWVGAKASIIEKKAFKSVIMKIQCNQQNNLYALGDM